MKFRFQKTIYNGFVLPVTYAVVSVMSLFHQKLKATIRGRRNVKRRWEQNAASLPARPIWFHVSSVGEFEQAKPVITALGRRFPDIPVAVSFSSPSGLTYAQTKESIDGGNNIKFIDYLPLDFSRNARFCLDCLDPRLLVFVKFDLWPNLVWEAAKRGTPQILIDATLSRTSYRFSSIGKRFYRSIYANLDEIMAISSHDAQRFHECNPAHLGISVIGDTRYDRVLDRKRASNGAAAQISEINTGGRFVVVAGSTWPRDEAHLLGALKQFAQNRRELLIVIAPHEPAEERVAELLNWAESSDMSATTLSHANGSTAANGKSQVIVVDSVGVLAEVYELANVAYVGGSFSTGVHSVIEPAIMGIPVLFGPIHANSFEALELLGHDAAIEVKNEQDMIDALVELMQNPNRRTDMGSRARSFVESQLGATERCMAAIDKYLK